MEYPGRVNLHSQQANWWLLLSGRGHGGGVAHWGGVLLWGDENVLKVDGGGGRAML